MIDLKVNRRSIYLYTYPTGRRGEGRGERREKRGDKETGGHGSGGQGKTVMVSGFLAAIL